MALAEANWTPSQKQLRQFGMLCGLLLPCVAWLWSASTSVIVLCAVIGCGLAALGWIRPIALKPLFVGLMLITWPIGVVVGELAMLLIFVLVFFPMGLAFRLMRRDRLRIKLEPSSRSYWQPKAQPKSVASYYHQS